MKKVQFRWESAGEGMWGGEVDRKGSVRVCGYGVMDVGKREDTTREAAVG